ncbi:MAG: sugar porter family MFS transporter [Verrucomicrobiota bacterium]
MCHKSFGSGAMVTSEGIVIMPFVSTSPGSKLFFWSITCALAGFIFGFDLIVISGAEQEIQSLWNLSDQLHGLAISAALWGTVLGSLIGALPTDRFGRKKTLLSIGILYFVSAIWSALANDPTSFMIARFIGGLGIGVSTVAAPIFISEISPSDRRGRLTGMFQFNIVLGLLIATLSNFAIASLMSDSSDLAWRWMLGVEAIPALFYSFLCFLLPESPRWLIGQGRKDEAKPILKAINPSYSTEQVEALATEIENANRATSATPTFSWQRLRLPIFLAFLVAFFNQLSGINAILGFAPRIFQLTGIDTSASLLNSSLITLTNLVFTFVGLYLIDRLGRRTLLTIGSFGYIASLGICAWAFHQYSEPFEQAADAIDLKNQAAAIVAGEAHLPDGLAEDPSVASFDQQGLEEVADAQLEAARERSGAGGTLVLICILAFIAAHAVGQGTVIWVLISEIFPPAARGFGQSLGSATHWVFAAILTLVFPWAMGTFAPSHIFAFFAFMMLLQLLWVKTMVPETKGVSLEDMEATLGGK